MKFIAYCTEHERQWLSGYRIVISILVAHPWDCMAYWELWLNASTRLHKRVSYHISQTRKGSKFKIWSTVSTKCISPLHNHKVEKSLSWTITSWRPSIFILYIIYMIYMQYMYLLHIYYINDVYATYLCV